jgi:hypothetical protein
MRTQWKKAERAIKQTDRETVDRYLKYWLSIKPAGLLDYYWRWLFAFASIRTTWVANCRLFIDLKCMKRYFSYPQLAQVVLDSHCGMYNVRTRGIWEFTTKYWTAPKLWYPGDGETFVQARDRMMKELHGIGPAKTSFVFEMGWPEQSEVACLDTHILQLYGGDGHGTSDRKYRDMERHWTDTCKEVNLPSPIVRHIYWDRLRNQNSTEYWSHVLHNNVFAFTPLAKAA